MGFSLLELLIALTMMAVLVGSGMPGLQQTIERVQMQTLMHSWLLVLQQNKTRAMADNRQITVALDELARQPSLTVDSRAGWQFSHNYSPSAALVFDGQRGYARAGSLQLQSPQLAVKIIISGLGRIRSCQSAGQPLAGLSSC
ncbi:prepilin-type N-terminal cleavage/methylation domain-containing protein [Idiomarina seosinensis]|uniref:Tfp pilus assembly protein FimT/FimU n=1 Tax=Idiomarina seosinensis TaxID=281739 RepID=UPI0038516C3D